MADKDISRREALQKLAKLSVYSAPTVVTLLSAQKSYAITSYASGGYANGDLSPGETSMVAACLSGSRNNLGVMSGLGLDTGTSNNSTNNQDSCG